MTTDRVFTLPSMDVRLVVEVYSDEVIRSKEGFFRGVVGDSIEYWGILDTLGDKGLRICSDWVKVEGGASVEESFAIINPGFFEGNSTISYQFSCITPTFTPSN
jgi:hypothetical protein